AIAKAIGLLCTDRSDGYPGEQQDNNQSIHHQSNNSRIRFRSSSEWKGISMAPLPFLSGAFNRTRVENFDAKSSSTFWYWKDSGVLFVLLAVPLLESPCTSRTSSSVFLTESPFLTISRKI